MSFSANTQNLLYEILKTMPYQNFIKTHGVYHLTVPKDWKSTPQMNNDLHILYVQAGEGYYYFEEGNKLHLKKGTLVFISCNCKHWASTIDKSPLTIYGLRFGLYDNNMSNLSKCLCPSFYLSTVPQDIPYYEKILNRIYSLFQNNTSPIALMDCNNLIYHLLLEIFLYLKTNNKKTKKDLKVEKAKDLIDKNAYNSFPINSVAKVAGLSERQLREQFQNKYNLSPKQYQIQVKMNYAYFLLESSGYNIRQISDLLGYKDPYIFSKQFKKVYGFPPSILLCTNGTPK